MSNLFGVVKWFSETKGFGFIEREGAADVFVHYRDIKGEGFKTLIDGQKVEYSIEDDERGPRAKHVRPIVSDKP